KSVNEDIESLNIEGKSTNNPQAIASAFNEYFLSLAEKTYSNNNNNNNPIYCLSRAFNNSFPNINLKFSTRKEIENIIKSLKPKNSHGYDEISTKLLKASSVYISSPLNHLCNKSLSSGTFPQRLKYAVMKPLFKKGERKCISNYRPISILTSFSKVFEKVMYNRLLEHLNSNNILVKEQFGFRKDLTTEKATYELTNDILSALNDRLIVGGIFCDLAKAFDCVNHDILLSKLNFYGITGKANEWIKSYLKNRYQRVEINNKNSSHNAFSNWGIIKHGVPQGSILGPLLFLLYINDLSKTINNKSKPILYADDTSIIFKNSKFENFKNDINIVFEALNRWFEANLLSLNFDKTHYISFTTKNNHQIDLDISYANKLICKVLDTKFLGIHVDSTLSWKIHIEQIIPKLNAACYAMRSIKPFMSQETLKMVYHAYFHSIMNYGLIFWGNSSHSVIIFKIQKNIIRIITGCRSRDSCRELFKKLKILPLQSQYILSLLLFVVYNKDKFKLNSDVYNMNTRQKYNFHLPSSTLSVYQKGVYFTGIKVFNNLPQSIKNLGNDTKKFKSELKNYLHAHSFYSLDEYFNVNRE
ncbi:hypothetical protein B7P43_G15556, partial [Cryptotermes secundus]